MASTTAIVNGVLIDATGAAPVDNAVIVIVDDTITAAGPAADITVPADATIIDAAGKWIIPGLMDANVHLVSARTPDTILEFEGRYDELVREAAEIALKYGLTTIFDTWGPAGPTAAIRDRINAGELVGSRIYMAGNILGLGGPLADDFFPIGSILEPATMARINAIWEEGTGTHLAYLTPAEVKEVVRDYIQRTRPDFIKYAATDHVATGYLMLSEESQRAIVEAAHEAGLTVQAHTTTVESLRIEVELGADLLQHPDATIGRLIPDDLLDTIVQNQIPCAALVRTKEHEDWLIEQSGGAIDAMMNNLIQNDNALIAKGARVVLTTDGFAYGQRVKNHPGFRPGIRDNVPDMPTQIGISHFFWIRGAVQRGLDPMEALRSATSYIAEAYQVDDQIGTLVPGKKADLLILTADPLADPRNYQHIETVMKDGAVIDRAALGQNLLLADDPGL